MIRAEVRAPTRVAQAEQRAAAQIARTMEWLNADLRLGLLEADIASALRSGRPPLRIRRPDGRVTIR